MVEMKLSRFKVNLPDELIALQPTEERDQSRLMVIHKNDGRIEHRAFTDILDYFDEHDLFVFNNTKVFPARMYGNKEKTGAIIEVFLLRELNAQHKLWDVLVEPARKIRIGNKLYFGEDNSLVAEVIDNTTSRGRTVRFLYDAPSEEFRKVLFSYGESPIPEYLRALNREVVPEDMERYQTLYAEVEGAVSAPMAGAHFSREMLMRARIKGVDFSYVTLHNSLSPFREIDVEDLSKHKQESEQMEVNSELCKIFNAKYAEGKNICAVGISSLRALETAVTTPGMLKPYEGWTNKFIYPPYDFATANKLLTNFHLSQSSLLMAAASFGGYENVMKAYDVAIAEKYRFGCYGDAMLIV